MVNTLQTLLFRSLLISLSMLLCLIRNSCPSSDEHVRISIPFLFREGKEIRFIECVPCLLHFMTQVLPLTERPIHFTTLHCSATFPPLPKAALKCPVTKKRGKTDLCKGKCEQTTLSCSYTYIVTQ